MIVILHRNHKREQSLATSNNRYGTSIHISEEVALKDQQKKDYPNMSEYEVRLKFIIAHQLSMNINIRQIMDQCHDLIWYLHITNLM